ncbi:MAG: hypothetical protein GXP28_04260 [Planctomycetes bacterium]|nr:hypothetical protein [Planctomycetota bacterium]
MITPEGIVYGTAVLLALFLIRGWRQARGTTLRAPCLWALVSVASVALGAAIESLPGNAEHGIGLSALRFATAASTFCPLMAILGSKRPQNRGWQWVVLTLWIVVVWPAAQAVLIPTGLRLELSVVWKLFLLGLVVIGLFNYLPTRNGLAACVFVAGQMVLLDSYLWNWNLVSPQWAPAVGLGCFLAAALRVGIRNHKKKKRDDSESKLDLAELDRRWLDFRDAYGALWALRILARINQTAEVQGWPMRLVWSGFTLHPVKEVAKLSEEQLEELRTALSTLLRRFV